MRGKIRIAIGPMWAGKTSWLISEIEKAQLVDKKVLVVSYTYDNRYSKEHIATHNGNIFKNAEIRKMDYISPEVCQELAATYNFIAIDEGQFFKNIAASTGILSSLGCEVVISCLSGDFKQKMFDEVKELIPIADKIMHFRAICMKCKKNKAAFTHKIVAGDEQVSIGGGDKYIVVCGPCLEIAKK